MQVEDVTEMIGRKVLPQTPAQPKGSGVLFKISVLVLVILIAAFAVSFILKSGFFGKLPSLGDLLPVAATSTPAATTTSLPTYVPTPAAVNFDPYADIEKQQFFRIPPDASFSMVLSRNAAQTSEDLLTFQQKIIEKLKNVPTSAKFIEVDLEKDGGKPTDGLTFMSLSGIHLFTDSFYKENLAPNITAFVYRNAKGSWPGYIFKILPNKNTRLLAPQVQILERSPESVAPLFLVSPGLPSGQFSDTTRVGVPIRERTYSAPGATIGYGWADRYFIISTSAEGMEEALRRLLG